MPTFSHSNLPTPKSWDEFEDISLSAMQVRWANNDLVRHGRQGQRQDGIDIYGKNDKGEFVGVQCKNTIEGISSSIIETELLNAESFSPKINHLYITTTAKRDVTIQKYVRELNERRTMQNKFGVTVIFWDDICNDLSGDENKFFKHFPQLKPKIDKKKESDQILFNKFIKLLPSNGVISFLGSTNMAGFSFRDKELDPLREFYYVWQTAEYYFLNQELEKLRKQLHDKSDQYLEVIASETFTNGGHPYLRSVPKEWEFEQPERFNRIVKELHKLAGEIVKIHQSLIMKANEYFTS